MQKAVPTTSAAVISELGLSQKVKKGDDSKSSDDDVSDSSSVIADKEEVFFAFDQRADRTIDAADLGHVFRCMNLNVTNADVEEIEAQLVKEENGSIKFEYLIPRISAAFDNKKFHPKFEETVDLAFQSLESHAGTEISKEILEDYLKSQGEPFTDAEFNELLSHMIIRRNGKCDWKCYVKDVVEAILQNSI